MNPLNKSIRALSAAAIAVAFFAIFAWLAGIPALTRIRPEYVPASPTAALAHLLWGISLYILAQPELSARSRKVALVFISTILILGVIGCLEFLTGNNFTPEFFRDNLVTPDRQLANGISPLSAAAFLFAPTSLILLILCPSHPVTRPIPMVACLLLFINLTIILGYLYGTPILYGGNIRPVGVLSSIAVTLLSIALLLFSGPHRFPVRLFFGPSISARLLRALLISTFVAALGTELFSDVSRKVSLLQNPAVQDAVRTLLASILITLVVLRNAREIGDQLDCAEGARQEAETRLLLLNQDLEKRVQERTLILRRLNADLRALVAEKGSAEALLRSAEARNRALLEAVPDWIFRVRVDGTTIPEKTPRGLRVPVENEIITLGESLQLALASTVSEFTVSEPAAHFIQREMQVRKPHQSSHFEARFVSVGSGEYLAIVRDITQLKLLEDRVLDASAREQRRIGRDLHDGVGQHLTGIAFMAQALQERLVGMRGDDALLAAKLGMAISTAISELKSVSRGLFQIELAPGNLVPALQDLSDMTANRFAVSCSVSSPFKFSVKNPSTGVHLYRIVQEAITNSVKHGSAKSISVTFIISLNSVQLTISDDGNGFSRTDDGPGMGLRIMEYRATRIGGSLSIESSSSGTRVICSFPKVQIEV